MKAYTLCWNRVPVPLVLVLVLAVGGCSFPLVEEPPFSFTTFGLFSRPGADGASNLVFQYGLENRSKRHAKVVRVRANLYRDGAEPTLLFSIDSHSEASIPPGGSSTIEVVLNPLLHYDPGAQIFLEGITVAKIEYGSGAAWRNPVGLFPYPDRIRFGSAPDSEG